jgi:hypothetical protein
MITRPRIGYLIASVLLLMSWPRPAAADLILSLDQSSYTINGIGNTTAVEVFVSQNSTGNQVGVGNELLTAAIELTFPTAGAATVVSPADVTFNPAWDSGGPPIFTPSGTNTLVDLGVVSLLGFSNLSPPLLIGTFIFTGQFVGTTSISVASLEPGPSFITANPNDPVSDPTNTPGAEINVVSNAIPEPGTAALLGIAGLTLGVGWLRYRAKRVPGSASRSE